MQQSQTDSQNSHYKLCIINNKERFLSNVTLQPIYAKVMLFPWQHISHMCAKRTALEHCDLPMTHRSVCGLDDERLLLPFAFKLLHVVLELSILRREDPGFGNEAVFLRLAFNHPERKRRRKRRNSHSSTRTRESAWRTLFDQEVVNLVL